MSVLFNFLSIFGFPKPSEHKENLRTLKMFKLGQRGYVIRLGRLKRETVYSGLGKENRFTGAIKTNDNYVKPCYVYADLTESETFSNGHGKVIGYRISPTLVLHSMVGTNYLKSEIDEFIQEFGGKLLNAEDIKVLRKNFFIVSKMRKAIGDTALPESLFWAMPMGNVIEATHAISPYGDDERAKIANIILKR